MKGGLEVNTLIKKKKAPIKKIREKSALEKQVYRNQTNRVECFPLESPSSLLIE